MTKIQEKIPKFKERMEYLAAKRGLTYEEFFNQCLSGKYQRMSSDNQPEENQE